MSPLLLEADELTRGGQQDRVQRERVTKLARAPGGLDRWLSVKAPVSGCLAKEPSDAVAAASGSRSLCGKFMRIRTFYYLPPKAGFNWRGPARR
jgi:hypothetical protein